MRGRIAYDARVELLTESEVARLVAFQSGLSVENSPGREYPVIVLSPDDTEAIAALADGGFRVLRRDDRAVVLVRPALLRAAPPTETPSA